MVATQEIISQIKQKASDYGRAVNSNDFKAADRFLDVLDNLYTRLREKDAHIETLESLLADESEGARLWSATRLLQFNSDIALKVLKDLCEMDAPIGYDAKMVISEFDKGNFLKDS